MQRCFRRLRLSSPHAENRQPRADPLFHAQSSARNPAASDWLREITLQPWMTGRSELQRRSHRQTKVISDPDGLPGRLVATVAGTSAAGDLRDRKARVRECVDLAGALREAASGRVEAVVFDAPALAYAIKDNPDFGVRLVGPLFEHQDYGIVLPRGSRLRKAVNQALLNLAETGKLAEINLRWFGEKE